MIKRLLSAAVGIIIFILFTFWGLFPFFIMIAFLSLLGLFEYSQLLSKILNENSNFILIPGFFIVASTYLKASGHLSLPAGLVNIAVLLLLIVHWIFKKGYEDVVVQVAVRYLGLVYISNGFIYFFLLREFEKGFFHDTRALWLALIATWVTDSGAYFVGKFLGKHKLSPSISPNKTIEGAVGGIALTVILIGGFTLFYNIYSPIWLIFAALISIFAIAGDLFESAIKREVNVKDSGRFLPGHGGVLDRFDSLLFSVPFTYYFLIFFLQ